MRNYQLSSIPKCITFCLIIVLSTSIFAGVIEIVGAEEVQKSLNLNLTIPPHKEGENQKPDPISEKYNEVMQEIVISEEASEVVDQIKDVIMAIKDISMDILITQMKGLRNDQGLVSVQASVEGKVARIEFLEPSALRGHIMVADQTKMETRMYRPINNQIVVQTLEDVSKEALSALSIAQLTTYFDFTQYEVEMVESVEQDGVMEYLLEVNALDNQLWYVRVRSDSWIPHEVSVIEEDTLLGVMTLSNVLINPGLSLDKITKLPEVKEVRM